MPGLFVILQLGACLSEAFHSFSLTLLWPFEGLAALRAKSPGPSFSEAGSPRNGTALSLPCLSLCFLQRKAALLPLKRQRAETRCEVGQ